ncbi:MAG: hypothetical protein HOV80_10975 [Polyangiaceae bacterium]|nr:hypothetical protein [Polyangiaceae bacterium]
MRREILTAPLLLLLAGACAGVPWGQVPEASVANAVPAGLICAGDAAPASAEGPAPTVEGRYPPQVYEVMQSRREAHEDCYVTSAWGNQEAGSVRINLSFSIDEYGNVDRACVQKPVPSEGKAVECILDDLKAQKFGHGKRAQVTYPVELAAASPPNVDPSAPPVSETKPLR